MELRHHTEYGSYFYLVPNGPFSKLSQKRRFRLLDALQELVFKVVEIGFGVRGILVVHSLIIAEAQESSDASPFPGRR